jgi:hypothetical protein
LAVLATIAGIEFPQFDPMVASRLEDSGDLMRGLPDYLGVRHVEVGPGLLRAELEVRDEL